ncbi:CRISPR system Cascade subunit CasA [Actinoalloteichus hoggarensis]|uniref:CRISPR-associated protein CasA/Cse1 n=1 Tax=Actinoalloteichus hoggarensis TaxID=1470176 RepID=A0A221W7S4_9PSEU|nr:type I-E CRISPR-associated protein Cse1/CasA [Actinoalloteichus hoggarensis]ASO21804.1 CRISPR-associated protein CasA/Cse1 [Actinoalloteichus hoggarensis]MBB5922401.1 CRISPR system Cascade subunit CasA [Actinoalloteichus hoggarensis]
MWGEMRFNLLDEPWIPVVTLEGASVEVGLADLFGRSGSLCRLVGASPTMTAALYRLVLAVTHRVFRPATDEDWAQLWERDDLRTRQWEDFLARDRNSFDLFHPERPFLQSRSLSSVAPSGIARLVPFRASGSNATLFDHTTSADRLTLSPAEAARWLVTLQCYDPGGLKSGAYPKAPRSSERAPANNFGCVVVEGGTLKETLLLNLLSYDPLIDQPPGTGVQDRPSWEDTEVGGPEPVERTPLGWTDLLTWPSRRVLLTTDGDPDDPVVDGVVITPGTRLRPVAEDQEHEWMAALRRPIVRGTARGNSKRYPVRLEEQRGVWRHAEELLLAAEQRRNIEQSDRRRPAALDAIARRTEYGLLPEDAVFTLRVFGQQLDSKQAVVQTWLEESVPAPVALLRTESERERLGAVVGHSCRLADDVGFLLRRLDKGYREDFAVKSPPALEVSYWPQLTAPFHTFILDLGAAMRSDRNGSQEHAAVEAWRRAVARVANAAADRWVYGAARRGARELSLAGKHDGRFRAELGTRLVLYRREVGAFLYSDDRREQRTDHRPDEGEPT